MATQQTATTNKRSEAGKKAAATRAAKQAQAPVAKMQAPNAEHNVTDEQRQAEQQQAQTNAVAQFSASTQTTPAAHETPSDADIEAAKQKAFQDAVQALAASMGVQAPALAAPAATPAKAPRAERPNKNGITRPASNTETGKIWDLADKLSAEAGGQPVAIATLRAHAELKQTNENTLKTQYARWRGYHGIKGRVAPAQQQAKSPEGRDEGIENAFGRRAGDVERRAQ